MHTSSGMGYCSFPRMQVPVSHSLLSTRKTTRCTVTSGIVLVPGSLGIRITNASLPVDLLSTLRYHSVQMDHGVILVKVPLSTTTELFQIRIN